MRFLRKNKKVQKHVLVISDLHLGAGAYINGSRNLLEDFHSDEELIDFLRYFSTGEYTNKEIELVINGDFLDLLAVPYVKYFDDEYWSEPAALEKLELILKGHPEVLEALAEFVRGKNKKIVYIIGNHDGELFFDSLKARFLQIFDEEHRSKVTLTNELTLYQPSPGVFIQHGHEYEIAHNLSPEKNMIISAKGEKYFIPSWGSYYVAHIVNKYKQERRHINEVTPISNFLIHGLIYDTYFTIRFILANIYYFVMVRFMDFVRSKPGWKKILGQVLKELTLFENYEHLTRSFFRQYADARVLIVGHTHKPNLKEFSDGTIFVNTGTWMRTVNLDLKMDFSGRPLTFAHIQISEKEYELKDFHEKVQVDLLRWAPKSSLPYEDYL